MSSRQFRASVSKNLIWPAAVLVFGAIGPLPLHARTLRIEASRIEPSRSTTVITSSEIEKEGAATVADLLKEVPGLELIRQGTIGQTTSVFLRGARAESTLVLIDGQEVNDVMSPGAAFDFSTLSASGVERIEIYRGPQSVRFGAGALGGVIHIITKAGRAGFHSQSTLEVGSYNLVKTNIGFDGGSEQLTTLFNLESITTDGFSASSGRPEPEEDGATVKTVNSKTTWTPSKDSKVSLVLRHSNAEVDLDQFGGASGDDPNFTSKSMQWVAGLSGSKKFLDEKWISELGIYFSELNRKTNNLPDATSTTDARDNFWGQHKKFQWDNEFIFNENHRLLFQLQRREESGHSHSEFIGLPSSIDQQTESVTGESLTYLYESDSWFGDLGLRLDQSSKVSSVTSLRASLGKYLRESGTKIFASYGTGFKLPSLYQLYSSYGDENLGVEESSTYEISLEQKVGENLLSVLTYFDSKFTQLIDFNFLTNTYFNMASARSKGLETQLNWQLSPAWGLGAWYTYLEARDNLGAQLLRRPYHSGGAEISFKRRKLDGYFRYVHRGERPDVDPSTFARSFNPSYDLTHVGAGYQISGSWKFNFKIDNVFDKTYQEVLGYGTARRSFFVQLHAQPSFL